MTAPAHEQADAVRDSLTCPQCQYSLRGLPGEIVNCPECGLECDIRRMMSDEWRRPWFEAPGFSKLLRPVSCLTIGSLVLFYVGVMETDRFRGSGLITATGVTVLLAAWGYFVKETLSQFRDGRGPGLALLAHLLFAGYLASVFGIGMGLFGLIMRGQPVLLILGVVVIATMIGLMAVCRRGERFIAQQCLNEYLRRDVDSPKSWREVVSS